jgi:DNA-binding SARP family transcriptional activator
MTTSPDADDRALLSAGRLLDAGHYREAADLLLRLERSRQAVGDVVEVEILAAARRLCLACLRQSEEMNAQHQAAQAAEGMEHRLRERLSAILDLAATRLIVAPERAADPTPSSPPSSPVPGEGAHGVLAVQCLGAFCVLDGGRPLAPWPNRRAKAVFKYLVVHHDRPVLKEALMDVFWPGVDLGAARNNLNVAVHALRRFLRDAHADVSHVVFRDGCYALDPGLRLWVDVDEFERLAARGEEHDRRGRLPDAVRDLHAAEVLYQGGLFEDDPYEEWILLRRRELEERYVSVLERLSKLYHAADDERACVDVARRILAVEPFREGAHRELMRCYARQGQQHLALRQYADCARALDEALDMQPEPETVELYEQIRCREPV